MSTSDRIPPDEHPSRSPEQARLNRVERRRQKIADEIARNRRGDYRVPTWVLVLALVLIVGGWFAVVLLS